MDILVSFIGSYLWILLGYFHFGFIEHLNFTR